MRIGCFLSGEEYPPDQLLDRARRAAAVGPYTTEFIDMFGREILPYANGNGGRP